MDRLSAWIDGQIAEHSPERSDDKQSVAILADACAALSGRGGLVFGMSMSAGLQDADELHGRACAALAAWFPKLAREEAEMLATRVRQQGLAVAIPELMGSSPSAASAESLESSCARLSSARAQSLRRLGTLHPDVLSRSRPIELAGKMYCWPANAIGALRLVRTPDSVVLVTDGLSNPWDPSLHDSVPSWTFGFELAIEVPLIAFADPSDQAIAASWAPVVLWAATDWVVAEREDLLGRIEQHEVITHAIPPVVGLEHLKARTGVMGSLIGMPYVGDQFGASLGHGPDPHVPGIMTCLLTMKLLTCDEYEWVTGVNDSSRARALAELFIRRGERHRSWPRRASALGALA